MFNIRFTPHLRCSVEGGRLKYTQRSKQPPRDLTTPAKGFSIYFYFQNFSPTYQHVSHHPWNKFKTVSSCTWWHDHLVQFPRLCLQGNYEDGDFDIQALTWSPDMLNCPPPPKKKDCYCRTVLCLPILLYISPLKFWKQTDYQVCSVSLHSVPPKPPLTPS